MKEKKSEMRSCEICGYPFYIMSMDFIRIARNADGGAVEIIQS